MTLDRVLELLGLVRFKRVLELAERYKGGIQIHGKCFHVVPHDTYYAWQQAHYRATLLSKDRAKINDMVAKEAHAAAVAILAASKSPKKRKAK